MPKTKGKRTQKRANRPRKASSLRNPAELLDQAKVHLDAFELDQALQCVTRLLRLDANCIEGLELKGEIQLQYGLEEESKKLFQRAVELQPDEGFTKYMYLGQLSQGLVAMGYFQKGVDIMVKEHEKLLETDCATAAATATPSSTSAAELKRHLSTGYCSLAELFLADLCMEELAEPKCGSFIEEAIKWDETNSEAHQLKASYLISLNKEEEARESITRSLEIWWPRFQENQDDCDLSYDTRISAARILIELKEYQRTVDVLDSLLEEDDQVVQVWYLLGWTYYLMGADGAESARFYLQKAKELTEKIQHFQKYLDDEVKAHIDELLQELGNAGEAEDVADGADNQPAEGEDDDDEANWSSEDSEMELDQQPSAE